MMRRAKWLGGILSLLLVASSTVLEGVAPRYERYRQPELFSYEELLRLYEQETLPAELEEKLRTLTITPFLSNEAYYRGAKPHRPRLKQLGRSLRVVMWNIERGFRLDAI